MNFYDSIIEAAQELPEQERGQLYTAVLEYLKYHRLPEFRMRPAPKAIFIAMRPVLDNQLSLSERGRKGGRPRKAESRKKAEPKAKAPETGKPGEKPTESQPESQTKPRLFEMAPETGKPTGKPNESEQEQEQEREKPLTSVSGKKSAKARKPFVPPSVDDVARVARERNLTLVDPEEFWAHYDAQGWLLGNGNHMVNWESKLISWNSERRLRQQAQGAEGAYDATYD